MSQDLDDPAYRSFAWNRFRRIMVWMTVVSAATAALGLAILRVMVGPYPLLMAVFSAAGIFFTVLLAAFLMGLIFLSSGTGHDERTLDPTGERGS